MLFNSYIFIFVFLPIAFVGFYIIGAKSHSGAISWLALVSLCFYGYWSLYSLPILTGSICVNYWFGLQLSDRQSKYRKSLLVLIISLNLLVLGYFKYANFMLDNTNEILNNFNLKPIPMLDVVLPIGISFFTFTQIAYLIDTFRDEASEKTFFRYALFVTFFPHLIAGPIYHHKQMRPQFSDPKIFKLNHEKISLGLVIFTIGLAKKLLLADPLGGYADVLFNGVEAGITPNFMLSWVGSFAYSFQLYFDFSGYCDMAIGLALLFGIWLPINFNSPFKSSSIIEFWQRWHITLTKWIGEYLYTPITLKMTRASHGRSGVISLFYTLIFPTIFIFLILGLWHGPSWTYVLFGLIHGIYVVINHLWRKVFPIRKSKYNLSYNIRKIVGWFVTFIAVNISFVMFRSDSLSSAHQIYKGMISRPEFFNFGPFSELTISEFKLIIVGIWQYQLNVGQSVRESIVLLLLGFIIVLAFPSTASISSVNPSKYTHLLTRNGISAILLAILFVITILHLGKTSPFLYFEF